MTKARCMLNLLITLVLWLTLLPISAQAYAPGSPFSFRLTPWYKDGQITYDITKQTLNWQKPRSRLQLEASATVADDIITYVIYPKNVGGRMWDLKVNVPIPEGTTFLSAKAPPPFVTSFDGREVTFFTTELERAVATDPLIFIVSTKKVTTPVVVTHAWATWKNVGKSGRKLAEESTRTGDIIVQPHAFQKVVSDMIGDVPLSNYDLTSVAFQENQSALKIDFHTVGSLQPPNERLIFVLYIDGDCDADTGQWRRGRGVEYQIQYQHSKGRAKVKFWNEEKKEWGNSRLIKVDSFTAEGMISVRVPYDLLKYDGQFCWVVQARNKSTTSYPNPPSEWIPNGDELRLTQYEAVAIAPAVKNGKSGDVDQR